jgi:hypothetical protein
VVGKVNTTAQSTSESIKPAANLIHDAPFGFPEDLGKAVCRSEIGEINIGYSLEFENQLGATLRRTSALGCGIQRCVESWLSRL